MTKHASLFIVCVGIASVALAAGCSKKSPEAPATATAPAAPTAPEAAVPEAAKTEAAIATPGTGGLTPQQIADAVSKTVCKRMTGCNPQGGKEVDCISGLSKDMAGNLSDKARSITQAQLDSCLDSINKATCEQLSASTPPTGCEFMN